MLSSIEICAGAGGQALGLEQAGFEHVSLVEIDSAACQTLRINRSHWNVTEGDLHHYSAEKWQGVELLAGGVPCPPFSKAGKQLGREDERDLFPQAIRLVAECRPQAVMLENVRGLLDSLFDEYRAKIISDLKRLGYIADWRLLNASDFGVPQLRPRVILVALKAEFADYFVWPNYKINPPTVGEALYDLMASQGWEYAAEWKQKANKIAPTLVGGSKKHGGPDLGPTRARRAWQALHVNGNLIGEHPPEKGFVGYKNKVGYEYMPLLTVRMAARIQGFPDWWEFYGKKTPAYRQVGNALPPPVAEAVGRQIIYALDRANNSRLAA